MAAFWNLISAMQFVLIWWTNIAVTESTRSCMNETHQIECPPGNVITIDHGSGGFSASNGQCDDPVDCETPFIQGAGESWGSNLAAMAIQKCNNQNSCSIFVVSWEGALSECGNRNTRMVYLETEHHCTQQATTRTESTKSCVNETHQIECPQGYVINIESGFGGFSASSGQCDDPVNCETQFIQGAGESWGSNLAAMAIQKCNNQNSCSIFVVSWQGARSECGNRNTRMVYLEIEHDCRQKATTATTTTTTMPTITTNQSQQLKKAIDSTNRRKTLDWYVYVAAGVGGLCIIIVIILIVVCLKRYRSKSAENKHGSADQITVSEPEENDTLEHAYQQLDIVHLSSSGGSDVRPTDDRTSGILAAQTNPKTHQRSVYSDPHDSN